MDGVCGVLRTVVDVFFFKQKTAYEMLRSLVGSEMCIRDRYIGISLREFKKALLKKQRLYFLSLL